MVILENIDIDIDIDKAILQNIDIDKISNRFKFGISNRASSSSSLLQNEHSSQHHTSVVGKGSICPPGSAKGIQHHLS